MILSLSERIWSTIGHYFLDSRKIFTILLQSIPTVLSHFQRNLSLPKQSTAFFHFLFIFHTNILQSLKGIVCDFSSSHLYVQNRLLSLINITPITNKLIPKISHVKTLYRTCVKWQMNEMQITSIVKQLELRSLWIWRNT